MKLNLLQISKKTPKKYELCRLDYDVITKQTILKCSCWNASTNVAGLATYSQMDVFEEEKLQVIFFIEAPIRVRFEFLQKDDLWIEERPGQRLEEEKEVGGRGGEDELLLKSC